MQRLDESSVQEFANAVWVVATTSQSDVPLFLALARGAKQRRREINVQEFASTAWAFATALQADVQLLVGLAIGAQ